jgi:hypothetical protein
MKPSAAMWKASLFLFYMVYYFLNNATR